MCGGRSSILHYGPRIETNNLYAPTPNGQSPSASLNKSNTPPPISTGYVYPAKAAIPRFSMRIRMRIRKISMRTPYSTFQYP